MDKYVIEFQYSSGIPASPPCAPSEAETTAPNLTECAWAFDRVARSMHRDRITEAEGGPLGWVYLAKAWDGISYGEGGLVGVLQYGPRGIRMERA